MSKPHGQQTEYISLMGQFWSVTHYVIIKSCNYPQIADYLSPVPVYIASVTTLFMKSHAQADPIIYQLDHV